MKKDQMDEIRKEFEELPDVKSKLSGLHHTIIWFGDDCKYHTNFNFGDTVNWLNGGFCIFQQLHGIKNDH